MLVLQVTRAATDRPKPVFKSTAGQLGIHKTAGVWPLLDSLLPSGHTSLLIRRWLRNLLLLPPPTEVAASIRTACQIFKGKHFSASTSLLLRQCLRLLLLLPLSFAIHPLKNRLFARANVSYQKHLF